MSSSLIATSPINASIAPRQAPGAPDRGCLPWSRQGDRDRPRHSRRGHRPCTTRATIASTELVVTHDPDPQGDAARCLDLGRPCCPPSYPWSRPRIPHTSAGSGQLPRPSRPIRRAASCRHVRDHAPRRTIHRIRTSRGRCARPSGNRWERPLPITAIGRCAWRRHFVLADRRQAVGLAARR
jgi:hypothetical protein